jgi:glycosyltransferase involved in cell wall biosynthesis
VSAISSTINDANAIPRLIPIAQTLEMAGVQYLRRLVRIVIDAIPVVPFGGYAVTLRGLLTGWDRLRTEDEIHVLSAEGVQLGLPESVELHRVRVGRPAVARRILVQSTAARRVCRAVDADVLLAAIPTTAVAPVGCPKVITVHDLRHELVPRQFSPGRRLLRKLSYGIAYRQAAGVICISERTRADLLRSRPWLRSRPVFTVHWAADHVDSWPRRDSAGQEGYALAFGHFPNKAVERVVDAWKVLRDRGEARPLVFVGLSGTDRERVLERLRATGLEDLITPLPWLDDEQFHARFASAGLIVFPSDFEGFGLPAVEAMRLGIPLVISRDQALREVTGGNATVVADDDPESLAQAVSAAWDTPQHDLDRARAHVDRTWEDVARETRAALAEVAEGQRR